MDIEFHYYITYIIARRAGFKPEDAYVLAYSSQYTDDNDMACDYINQDTPDAYSNYISQTMNILKPQKERMRIYPVFHFLPGSQGDIAGDSTRRVDGRTHILNTIPNSQNSRMVLAEALSSKNLYRIGIATHMYVDTFAHQNFVGADDSFNNMSGLLEMLIPSIGHADAQHKPDIPNLVWQDERLIPEHSSVDNKKRFLEATGCLFDFYCGYIGTSNGKDLLLADVGNAIGDSSSTQENRIKHYKALIGGEFIEYNEHGWFDDILHFENVEIPYTSGEDTVPRSETQWLWLNKNYKASHWFQFQEAVKAHQNYVLANIVGPIYEKMGQTTY